MRSTRFSVRWLVVAMLATGVVLPSTATAVLPASVRLESVSFSASDPLKGYIAGGFAPANGVVSYTDDGGQTWHATIVSNRWLHGVSASNDGDSATAATGLGYDWLTQTANSGVAWTFVDPVLSLTAEYYDVAYLAGGRRVAVGRWNTYGLLASSTGGAWTRDYFGPVYAPPSESEPAPTTQAQFAAIDTAAGGNVAWAVGNDWTNSGSAAGPYEELIRYTSNGGSDWTTQTVAGITTTAEITCLAVGDSTHAYIGRKSGALLRYDGATWHVMPGALPAGFAPVNAVDAFDANNVVVVGDGGKVFKSTNAAGPTPTWTAVGTTLGTTNALRGVQMLSASSWIVVGDNETIRRTTNSGASWIGPTGVNAPTVKITLPASGFTVSSPTITASGESADGGIGVAQVQVALQRKDGKYWSGSAWTATETWLSATTADRWEHWSASRTIDSVANLGGGLTIWARSRDGLGKYSTNASVINTKTKAVLSTPAVPSYVKRMVEFTTYAYVTPKHPTGATGTTYYFYRSEKGSDGKYRWVLRKSATAYTSNSTAYPTKSKVWVKAKIGAGKWLVKAKHADAGHLTSWTPIRYFTVH